MRSMLAVPAILAALSLASAGPQGAKPLELEASKVAALPAIDGKADDAAWKGAQELVIKVDQPANLENPKKKVTLKAVHDGDSVCFLLVWEDATKNVTHTPYVWDNEKKEYTANDEEIEDAGSISFALEGEFNPDMLAGVASKWDVWEWQACRTPHGFAKDKYHIYSKTRPEQPPGVRSRKFTDRNEQPIFIARPDDAGTPPVKKLDPPTEKKGDKIPQYEPQAPSGSAGDVQARGVWEKGRWTLEFRRKFKTGNADDAPFDPAKTVDMAVATFDQCEHSDHDVSGKIVLRFGK